MNGQRRIESADRLAAVSSTGLLGLPPAPGLDRLTRLASRLLGVPTSLVSLVTDERQVFASRLGLPEPWATAAQTPLSHSFCQYVVDDDAPLVISDAREDDRLRDNRAIDEIGVVAYAGMPIRLGGQTLGSFCVIDGHPREWTTEQLEILRELAGAVNSEIALIKAAADAHLAAATAKQQAQLIDAAPAAIIVRSMDGIIQFWNHGAEQMYGWAAPDAVGRDIHRLLATEFPGTVADVGAALLDDGLWEGELVHRHADGRTIVTLSRHVVRTGADGGVEVIETDTDITGRRRAEQALALSERRFRTQFNQSTIGQAIVGLDGRIIQVNQAYGEMLGYNPDDLRGRPDADLTHPADREPASAMLAGLFAGEYESYQRTKRVLHARGDIIDVRIGVRLVRDDDGSPLHLIGVIENITGHVRAQRERDAAMAALEDRNARLEQANQLKLDLMGMLSHDIGTPLSAIVGFSELLADQPMPDFSLGLLTRIRRAAMRIDELRHNVLAMCSLDAGTLTTRRAPVDLCAALREALDAVESPLPVDCPPTLRVLANSAHLQQIVVNFLTNAAKYGGGATAVRVAAGPDTVTIAVHDRGPGVPAGLRPTLFDRFTRADDTTAVRGHGLGLHIVASLARANHGSVRHRDNHPTGSVFELTLERHHDQPNSAFPGRGTPAAVTIGAAGPGR